MEAARIKDRVRIRQAVATIIRRICEDHLHAYHTQACTPFFADLSYVYNDISFIQFFLFIQSDITFIYKMHFLFFFLEVAFVYQQF